MGEKGVDWETVRWGSPKLAFQLARISPLRHAHLAHMTESAKTSQLNDWLVNAAWEGQTEFVRFLCSLKRQRGVILYRAFRIAAKRGHVDVMRLLLDEPCHRAVNTTTGKDDPLFMASALGHTAAVKLLLEPQVAERLRDEAVQEHARLLCLYRETTAFVRPHVKLTRRCVMARARAFADVASTNLIARSLSSASERGHTSVVRLLLAALSGSDSALAGSGTNVSDCLSYSLRSAAKGGHVGVVQLLIHYDISVTALNDAFCFAARHGHTGVVQLLLALPPSRGVAPGYLVNESLHIAAAWGRTDVVQLLLALPPSRGVDASIYDNLALRVAAEYGHTDVVRLLLSHGVDSGSTRHQALYSAASHGHADVVELLLAALLRRCMQPEPFIRRALHQAASAGHARVVQVLLGRSRDPKLGDF